MTNKAQLKVLLFGTHPLQFNGYSKVVYELMKCNETFKDYNIEFMIYGFQNFYKTPNHRTDTPQSIEVYDAFKHEEPKAMGFGVTEVRKYVNEHKPDVCIVYNDMMVLNQVITQLKLVQTEDGINFKIIAYIDQVYLNQKKEFIEFINKNADHGMLFTEYWEKCIKDQGLSLPTSYLQHGFNPQTYFPIPKKLARQYYNLNEGDFIVLNLNRNQPRKRWDTCLKAFAEIVSRYPGHPIKLLIATAVQGAWNLLEIFERELKKRNLTLDDGMKHVILLDNPQRVTDAETNILYNVADIGINTCDGEGFGLCNFEQAAIGIPQIVPRLGGFMDFFDDNTAMLVDPKMAYYVDNTRDAVCGEALLCDYIDYVEAFETLYNNKEMLSKMGQQSRAKILKDYKWSDLAKKLCKIVYDTIGKPMPSSPADAKELAAIADEIEKIDITEFKKDNEPTVKAVEAPKKTKKSRKEEILALKKQIDALLEDELNDNSDSS